MCISNKKVIEMCIRDSDIVVHVYSYSLFISSSRISCYRLFRQPLFPNYHWWDLPIPSPYISLSPSNMYFKIYLAACVCRGLYFMFHPTTHVRVDVQLQSSLAPCTPRLLSVVRIFSLQASFLYVITYALLPRSSLYTLFPACSWNPF